MDRHDRRIMRAFNIMLLAFLTVYPATATIHAQDRAQTAPQSPKGPTKYPVKRDQPNPEAQKTKPAETKPAETKPAAEPPTSTTSPAQPTRYQVKTETPAGGSGSGTTAAPAPSAPRAEAVPTADSFTAQGLINEPSLTAIYRGDFAQSTIDRDSPLLVNVMH